MPQYYVENSHPAIIPPETFELVQEEFRRRKAAGIHTSAINCFASRIICGDCGSFYGGKVWHSGTQYACTIWQCNKKFRKKEFCSTPHLKEEIVKRAFVDAFNSIIEKKDEILSSYEDIIAQVTNCKVQENECNKIDEECVANELLKRRYELNAEIDMCKAKRNQINAFIKEVEKQDKLLTEFDESLWCATLSVMVVKSGKEVVFKFKDETELPWGLENE